MPEVEVSAGTVEYEDTGGTGPVVVLLHGLMMDGSLWRHVVEELRSDYRLVLPTLPFGSHRKAMRAEADLSMGGVARIVGELLERLDLREVTLGMSDWGGGLLLVGSEWEERIGGLVICSCEAFENVPPKGAARLLPYLARVPGGMAAAVAPFRFDGLRRLPLTYGPLSRKKVPREVMDRWFGPVTSSREIRRDLGKYVRSAHQGRRELLAACGRLGSFEGPALVMWAREDKLMPRDHGRRLAELLPRGRLVEVDDSYTLIPQDQPELLGRLMREFLEE
jgi:pimeloyl-ACP methyl ester carboxylesterase